jgi:hypothetical protein
LAAAMVSAMARLMRDRSLSSAALMASNIMRSRRRLSICSRRPLLQVTACSSRGVGVWGLGQWRHHVFGVVS